MAVVSASTLRTLGQKEYEKRKHAALEIENQALLRSPLGRAHATGPPSHRRSRRCHPQVRELRDAQDFEKIDGIVAAIAELVDSPQANQRKGALHALAAIAIGVRQDVSAVMAKLLPPVLTAFSDVDPRVRYYACESLYNIAKVARAGCVAHLAQIFDGLFKLSADTDIQVQNGMQLLDRLMKDVVTESEAFDTDSFLPLLGERIYVSNPFSRQFLVGWISTLDSVPDIDMLQHLPVFFDGLFHMLADSNKEIRQQTFAVLSEFLREIRDAEAVSYAPIVHVLVQHSTSQDKFTRLTAITWLHALMSHGREQLLPFCAQATARPRRRTPLPPGEPAAPIGAGAKRGALLAVAFGGRDLGGRFARRQHAPPAAPAVAGRGLRDAHRATRARVAPTIQ